MTAITRLPWHPPKVRVLDWPTLFGPMQAFVIIIKDGVVYSFRTFPIVTVEFNAEGFVDGIIDAFRPLRSSDFEFFSGELTHHAALMGEGLLWSVIGDRTAQELRKIADSGRAFDGCSIERLDRHPVYGSHWKLVFRG